MRTRTIDVTADQSAARIAADLEDASACTEPTEVVLRVVAARGARKLVAKIFGGAKEHPTRAARGAALVARGYREITARIDATGDDVVSGEST